MPKISEHAVKKHKITEISFFFSAIVHPCNIAFSVVHIQVCFKSFLFIVFFFPAGQGAVAVNSIKRITCSASGLFV